jgi:hypothetical protein
MQAVAEIQGVGLGRGFCAGSLCDLTRGNGIDRIKTSEKKNDPFVIPDAIFESPQMLMKFFNVQIDVCLQRNA